MSTDTDQTTDVDTDTSQLDTTATDAVDASTTASKPRADNIPNINADIVSRKMHLEEIRFSLEKKRAEHDMRLELRREDFKENAALNETKMISNAQSDHWMKTYWRPAAAWVYMMICIFDFIICPTLSLLIPAIVPVSYTAWQSLTLSNGGLFHMAFGAILGISAWTRGTEKLQAMKQV